MQTSNKTGLVLKISTVLFILLALVVYKLNDYFKNEKQYLSEIQLRNKVVQVKTSVSSQLAQLKNVLSGYETELTDSNINWVQLDPFFAIAKIEDSGRNLKVSNLLVRSNTPAERWNDQYLEKALQINKSSSKSPILAQLFQDKSGSKFLILRFKTAQRKELVVVGSANYFQKFFDNERGENSTALLATTENTLAAHSEGDYIATQTEEPKVSKKKYLFEKEEILGTNLIAMNYILRKKISSGFVVPWSIIGVVVGFGFILIAVVFYGLDPIERKIERYKKQERDQIYKDTVGQMTKAAAPVHNPAEASEVTKTSIPNSKPNTFAKLGENQMMPPKDLAIPKRESQKENISKPAYVVAAPAPVIEEVTKTASVPELVENEKTKANVLFDHFKSLEEPQIDISDIEKALALDDLIDEEGAHSISAGLLKENLTSQKVSLSPSGPPIDKPSFALKKKDFKVDEFKVHIRRPDNS